MTKYFKHLHKIIYKRSVQKYIFCSVSWFQVVIQKAMVQEKYNYAKWWCICILYFIRMVHNEFMVMDITKFVLLDEKYILYEGYDEDVLFLFIN